MVKAVFYESWMAICVIYVEGEKIANQEIQEKVVLVQVGRCEGLDIEREGIGSQGESW